MRQTNYEGRERRQEAPRIGDVYTLQFKGNGSVQSGLRPCVIFQNNTGNMFSPNVVVLPITSNLKRSEFPTHVLVRADDSGLLRDSIVLCENPICVPQDSLRRYLTRLPDHYLKQIAIASIKASSAISFIDPDTLNEVWHEANRLNVVA